MRIPVRSVEPPEPQCSLFVLSHDFTVPGGCAGDCTGGCTGDLSSHFFIYRLTCVYLNYKVKI